MALKGHVCEGVFVCSIDIWWLLLDIFKYMGSAVGPVCRLRSLSCEESTVTSHVF